MSLNIGGAAETIDIGVRNDSGGIVSVGEVLEIKPDGDGFKVGVPAADNWNKRKLWGVAVGKPGSTYADGEEFMLRVMGPCKAMIQTAGATALGDPVQVVAGSKHLVITPVATAAVASANDAALIRGSAHQAAAGAVGTPTLYSVWLNFPSS